MEQQTFSQKLHRLEDIVRQLESPDIELELGLKLLEEGVDLHKQCQTILTESQAKITTLLKAEQTTDLDADTDKQAVDPAPATIDSNQSELPF